MQRLHQTHQLHNHLLLALITAQSVGDHQEERLSSLEEQFRQENAFGFPTKVTLNPTHLLFTMMDLTLFSDKLGKHIFLLPATGFIYYFIHISIVGKVELCGGTQTMCGCCITIFLFLNTFI
jgi:hypothetical protein